MRTLNLLGAPTNLGLKPYDDGRARRVDEAPAVLRGLGLAETLGATDLGDVAAGAYRDFERPPAGSPTPSLSTRAPTPGCWCWAATAASCWERWRVCAGGGSTGWRSWTGT